MVTLTADIEVRSYV